MVVDEPYRGLGIGAAMTNFFCNHFKSRRLFAACRPDSTMMQMLKRRRFTLYATTSTGYEIIMREH
jgi:ribosomal protein S18 acetylase RimI-like enzyme